MGYEILDSGPGKGPAPLFILSIFLLLFFCQGLYIGTQKPIIYRKTGVSLDNWVEFKEKLGLV